MAIHNFLLGLVFAAFTAVPALAVDTGENNSDAAMQQARSQIDSENWTAALATLSGVIAEDPRNADALNLMGYASRKSGALGQAEQFYNAALSIDPNHLGALEYQGELFVMTGRLDEAKANLAKLVALCGGCEEQADLAEALANAGA
jgi:Flp pilus assembly protein TadD